MKISIYINKYNCLIDTAGLLFMFNSNEIIKYIMSKLKYERYFYIDNNNNKKILKFNGNKIEEIIYNNEIYFIEYSTIKWAIRRFIPTIRYDKNYGMVLRDYVGVGGQ